MWDLPRPGLEPVSSALAGGFSTTAPPGKPKSSFFLRTFFKNVLKVLSSCFLLPWSSRTEIPSHCDPSRSWGFEGGDETSLISFYGLFLTSFCKIIPFKVAWHMNFPLTLISCPWVHSYFVKAVQVSHDDFWETSPLFSRIHCTLPSLTMYFFKYVILRQSH